MDMNHLVKTLENEPLIEHHPSLQRMADTILNNNGGALFYGTGLCNAHKLTIAMPFDALGMVLVAEKLRRMLGLSRVFHHIADTHAFCNPFNDREAVLRRVDEIETVMKQLVQRLGLSHFDILKSSSFDSSPEYVAFMKKVTTSNGEYARRELTDMIWYRAQHNVVIKLGWVIQTNATDSSFDERWYDDEYIRLFGRSLSFVYVKAGRTLNSEHPKAVPYIGITEEDRIFLRAGEQVRAKFDKAVRQTKKDVMYGATNYFAAICRLYESLVHPLDKGSVPQKIQQIIDHIFE